MAKRGVQPRSPESKIFGKRLLSALTDAYGYMMFGSGMIHGDPHPGIKHFYAIIESEDTTSGCLV
jgi:hypothetical protein